MNCVRRIIFTKLKNTLETLETSKKMNKTLCPKCKTGKMDIAAVHTGGSNKPDVVATGYACDSCFNLKLDTEIDKNKVAALWPSSGTAHVEELVQNLHIT